MNFQRCLQDSHLSASSKMATKYTFKDLISYKKLIAVSGLLIILYVTFKKANPLRRKLFAWLFNKYMMPLMDTVCQPVKEELFSSLRKQITFQDAQSVESRSIRLLEIGVGSGANFKYFPINTRLVVVEPNKNFYKYLIDNLQKYPNITLERFVVGKAENLEEIADNSIDVVVSTYVLCSVEDVEACLKEIKRVLVANGQFLFLEHVAYEKNSWMNLIQKFVEPFWRLFSDNCRLTMNTSELISRANFNKLEQKQIFIGEYPFVMRLNIVGIAKK